MNPAAPLRLAVVGAGPVGLALALLAARSLPQAQVQLFDARPLACDVAADPRTLALSLGSVQLLQRLGAWTPAVAQAIDEVHVSQFEPAFVGRLGQVLGEPHVRIRAADEGVPSLGAVLAYGAVAAPLQRAWLAACERAPARLGSRFGQAVAAIVPVVTAGRAAGIDIESGRTDRFDLAVVAEGGVFKPGSAVSAAAGVAAPEPLQRDYQQTAWVGTVSLRGGRAGVAYERFTRHGPAALLPLASGRAALVWCVDSRDDPVRRLTDAQRLTVLAGLFPNEAGEVVGLSPLQPFALGLRAQRTLVHGRSIYIGNAAQTLHPVAGQGLNLGLRDAFTLVRGLMQTRRVELDAALRRLEWQRAPDRWALIAATDALARAFTLQLPGAAAARGLGLAALQALAPLKSALARHMLYGWR